MALAQYDIVVTQNIAPSGVEFSEKQIHLDKGSLLTADANHVPVVLPAGTDGYMLTAHADHANGTGLEWVAVTGGHTQGTDGGTTAAIFEIDTDGFKVEVTAESASKLGIKVDGGATYADLQAKDASFNKVTVSTTPSADTDLTNKLYVDGILATNDAMIFKGTVGTGGTLEITAFNSLATYNAGWTYRVKTAGTIKGQVCEIGDMVIATVDRAGASNVDADFIVVQTNTDGAVIGPASVTDNCLVLFNGTTGKLIKAGTGAPGTMAYETALNYIPKTLLTEQGDIIYASAASTPAALAHGNAGQVLQSGGNAANPSWLTLGTMAAAVATDYVTKALYDAYSMLIADADNTPTAMTIGASTFVGRKASGGISAMTPGEAMAILTVAAPASNTAAGTINTHAWDANYYYVCIQSGTAGNAKWIRTLMSTNWAA